MEQNGKANGFSLVEVVVAMMVLTVGMLAMAASTGYMSAEIRNATWNTQRAFARNQTIEQLRSIPFDSVVTSSGTVGNFTMRWVPTTVNNNLKTVVVIASGPGYRMGTRATKQTIVDSVVVNIARP